MKQDFSYRFVDCISGTWISGTGFQGPDLRLSSGFQEPTLSRMAGEPTLGQILTQMSRICSVATLAYRYFYILASLVTLGSLLSTCEFCVTGRGAAETIPGTRVKLQGLVLNFVGLCFLGLLCVHNIVWPTGGPQMCSKVWGEKKLLKNTYRIATQATSKPATKAIE